MKLYNTNNKKEITQFQQAILQGLASNNGLFMPLTLPLLDINKLVNLSFPEISYLVASELLKNEIDSNDLKEIVFDTLTFPIPIVQVEKNIFTLELFHGPTLSFKDVGARFLARLISHFTKNKKQKTVVLVATSGDTGSAVGHGFYNLPNIDVVLLYPKNKVSLLQEKQLTTIGKNVTALEVEGTFDDCQRMVKSAFSDDSLSSKLFLTSANSINIGRLIPQSFYYFWAYAQLHKLGIKNNIAFSVPSGNFGNMTAGLFAKKMGVPIDKFIAATNLNDIVPQYLTSGIFQTKPSVQTISNAMDVGNPSNFPRMLTLYPELKKMQDIVFGIRISEEETMETIKEIYKKTNYILDPHGAVGYKGFLRFLETTNKNYTGVILETAHYAKFSPTMEEILQQKIALPISLEQSMKKEKKSIVINNKYEELKSYLTKLI